MIYYLKIHLIVYLSRGVILVLFAYKNLRIRILDENGRQININNSDFTVNIEVETLNAPYKSII